MKLPAHLIQKYVSQGNELFLYDEGQIIDIAENIIPSNTKIDISNTPFVLKPKQFILAPTKEKIWTSPEIICILDGRTTIARLGLTIHKTAQVADGNQVQVQPIMLEIYNHSNVTYLLRSGIPIGCVLFEQLLEPISGMVKAGVNVDKSIELKYYGE